MWFEVISGWSISIGNVPYMEDFVVKLSCKRRGSFQFVPGLLLGSSNKSITSWHLAEEKIHKTLACHIEKVKLSLIRSTFVVGIEKIQRGFYGLVIL